MDNSRQKVETIVGTAILTALVFAIQLFADVIAIEQFSIGIVLVLMVMGAVIYGYKTGMWLGIVFGLAVLLSGEAQGFVDAHPTGTVIAVLVKGSMSGLLSGVVYKMLQRKNRWVAIIAAAFMCPTVNTGIFLISCRIFFFDVIEIWAEGTGLSIADFIFTQLVGANFFIELFTTLILGTISIGIFQFLRARFLSRS